MFVGPDCNAYHPYRNYDASCNNLGTNKIALKQMARIFYFFIFFSFFIPSDHIIFIGPYIVYYFKSFKKTLLFLGFNIFVFLCRKPK